MDLRNVSVRPVEYSSFVVVPKEFYENTDILELKDVHLEFSIFKDTNQNDVLNMKCQGNMVLEDARSLNPVLYPFEFQMEEKIDPESEMCGKFLTNYQNSLDIMSVLWENIVLEIPISFTTCDPLKSVEEKTWSIIGEESVKKTDPRLAPLLELLDKEKE